MQNNIAEAQRICWTDDPQNPFHSLKIDFIHSIWFVLKLAKKSWLEADHWCENK